MATPEHLAGLGDAASKLKPAETVDKSVPAIDPSVHIAAAPKRTELLAGLGDAASQLKHADTVDKSAPVIDAAVHIKPSPHADLLAAIPKKD